MRDYKPLAITFLSAALVVTYLDREQSLAWTQDTAESIHRKTIAEGEKQAGIADTSIPASDNIRTISLLSFYLHSLRREASHQTADPVTCATETRGWRIPFTNIALAKSATACSIGPYAADTLLQIQEPAYALRY